MRRNESQKPNLSTIYVGLIPFEWSEDNLKAVVCGIGNVCDVRLGFDHIGKNKGFAFVEFETPQQAANAAQILPKIQIVIPSLGQVRRLRTEVKETFRSNDQRTMIPLIPENLPAGVQFPPEIAVKNPQLLRATLAKYSSSSGPDMSFNAPNSRGASHTPPLAGNMSTIGSIAPPNASNTLPDEWLKATQFLALPKKLPFSTPDKINETLSQIPPPQLIELIANLKNILNSADSSRAADVFRFSPHLAASATQALLLMGFIDEEVIQEAMKAEASKSNIQVAPTPPQQQNMYPGSFNQSSQGYTSNVSQPPGSYAQNYGNRQFTNHDSTYGKALGFNQGTGPSQNQAHGYNQASVPNQHSQRFNSGYPQNQNSHQNMPLIPLAPPIPPTASRWPHLPLLAQMKLANLPKDQADLIAQVLSLSPEDIGALPSDRQSMVAGIKQQYA